MRYILHCRRIYPRFDPTVISLCDIWISGHVSGRCPCLCVCMWMSEVNTGCLPQLFYTLVSETRSLTTSGVHWLARLAGLESLGLTFSYQHWGFRHKHYAWVLEIWIQVLMGTQQTPYPPSHLPSLKTMIYKMTRWHIQKYLNQSCFFPYKS